MVTTTRTRASRSWAAIASAESSRLTGKAIPAVAAASTAVTAWGTKGSRIATPSSGPTPSRRSAAAARRTSASSLS
jgi:hypothetical protein